MSPRGASFRSTMPWRPLMPLKVIVAATLALLSIPLWAADPSTADLIRDGHYKRAFVILQERLNTNSNDARSHTEMSKVAAAFQRWDDAVSHAEKAVAIDGKNADFHSALADALGSKLSGAQLGSFEKLSLARRFKKEAELTLQMDPNNVEANEDLMQFHLDAPGLLGGDKQKAEDMANRMVTISPAQGYLMKIEFATHEKHIAELDSLFQHALDADPKNCFAHVQAANYYLERGGPNLTRAEDLAKQAIQINPSRVGGYTALATLYAQQGRWKELDSVLADSKREVPDDFSPHYQAAKAILTSNHEDHLPAAEQYLQVYLSQPPEGNEPSLSAAHWRLGLILEKEGRKPQAKEELQQAVTLDHNFEPAKKDLKRLQ